MDNNEKKINLSDVGEELLRTEAVEKVENNDANNAVSSEKSLSQTKSLPARNRNVPPSVASAKALSAKKGRAEQAKPKRETKKTKLSELLKLKKLLENRNGGLLCGLSYYEPSRKMLAVLFCVLALGGLVLCTLLGYSYSGDSIRMTSQMTESERSAAKDYVIVYSEADVWGADAAKKLNEMFYKKTGVSLKIAPDSESVARHEIRIGHTNRSGDDYITTAAALGENGYAVLLQSGDNIGIAALSREGAETAVKYFVESYVGAYRSGKLTLARNMSISFVSRTGNEPDISLRQSKLTLNFTETGKFRALVLSDADINPNTITAIDKMVEKEKPHLVIFAGDVSSGMGTKAELEEYLKALTAPLEARKIPWTAAFGEQDTDGGLSAEAQIEVYSSFDHCIIKNDFAYGGTASHFLPIYKAGEGGAGSAPISGIWIMGQTGMLSLRDNAASKDPILSDLRENGTDYGYVTSNQIAWFSENQKVLDREAGGKMATVMVCHTPVPEFGIVAENPVKSKMVGNFGETVSASPLNSGLFTAILESGSVLGLYSGHDHLNTFSGKYCGIELGYSASIGYDGYGLGGTFDINNSLRGGRMIELSALNGEIKVSSRMIYASDLAVGVN